jgi:hypothetical protein
MAAERRTSRLWSHCWDQYFVLWILGWVLPESHPLSVLRPESQPLCCCLVAVAAPVTHQKLLVWLQWLYWISPMSWSIRSVALNEFNAPSYDFTYDLGNGPMRAGDAFLQAYEVQSDFKWKWAGIGYLAGMFIFNTRTCGVASV